jgi:hypothetical protein
MNHYHLWGIVWVAISGIGGAIAHSPPAQADSYGANNLGGSTYLSWRTETPTEWSGGDPMLIGYACVTRDTMAAMAANAWMHRYAVYIYPQSDYLFLTPLNGVVISPNSTGGWISEEVTPAPEAELWEAASLNLAGNWFEDEFDPDGLGQACLEGGIAGGVQYLETLHGISITDESDGL